MILFTGSNLRNKRSNKQTFLYKIYRLHIWLSYNSDYKITGKDHGSFRFEFQLR